MASWLTAPRARRRCQCLVAQTASSENIREAAPPPVASAQVSLPARPRGSSPQQAVWLLFRPVDDLTAVEQTLRSRLLDADEEIHAAHDLIAHCRDLLRTRGHGHLPAWQEAAEASTVPELRGFVASLQ
jgi:uncharacterized protein YecE (DUF72 family)